MLKINICKIAILFVLLSGCAAAEPERLNALSIKNKTSSTIYDVTLNVVDTNKVVSCSTILPQRDCYLGFPEQINKHETATLSWTQNDKTYKKELIGNNAPPLNMDDPLTAIVSVMDNGYLDVYLEEEKFYGSY